MTSTQTQEWGRWVTKKVTIVLLTSPCESDKGEGVTNEVSNIFHPLYICCSNEMGLEVLERLRFLASLPLAGTAQTDGGGATITSYSISPYVSCARFTMTGNSAQHGPYPVMVIRAHERQILILISRTLTSKDKKAREGKFLATTYKHFFSLRYN